MSDMEDKVHKIEAISDDELEAVAGGAGKWLTAPEAKAAAKADGRVIAIKSKDEGSLRFLCECPYYFKWARGDKIYHNDRPPIDGYTDIKCYGCGKTMDYIG